MSGHWTKSHEEMERYKDGLCEKKQQLLLSWRYVRIFTALLVIKILQSFLHFRSQDDPFQLYAALRGGPRTKIFSRDLMRGHSFLLDKEAKILFRRWQKQNQFSLITTLQNSEIVVQEPLPFEMRAHKINSCWHIPFTSENINFTYETFDLPSSWLCLKIAWRKIQISRQKIKNLKFSRTWVDWWA